MKTNHFYLMAVALIFTFVQIKAQSVTAKQDSLPYKSLSSLLRRCREPEKVKTMKIEYHIKL
ncbi:MAG: hypothetical protein LBR64_08365 [Dysgonamonadaceae bacterium]|nr:hypothetical protein [Dysgonamonadaceae bacterium]